MPKSEIPFALKKEFGFGELAYLTPASSLSTLKLFDSTFAVADSEFHPENDMIERVFTERLSQVPLQELVLHNSLFDTTKLGQNPLEPWTFGAASLPASLKRLQINAPWSKGEFDFLEDYFLDGLERLQNLECFILQSAPVPEAEFVDDGIYGLIGCSLDWTDIFEKIGLLQNLREFCVGHPMPFLHVPKLWQLIAGLPRLEVLFLNDVSGYVASGDLKELIAKNTVLRILVLSGYFIVEAPIEIPARRRFPNGFGAEALPLLHNLGEKASRNLSFAASASDAAIMHTIDQPMHEFLDRIGIAPFFDGVWVAEKIKATAKYGGKLFHCGLS